MRLSDQVNELARRAPEEPVTIVAHSFGAVVAVLAFAASSIRVRDFVFVEPALYDLARGDDVVERFIEVMSDARGRASAGDLFGFWEIVRPLMFGGSADPANWPSERPRAEYFASLDVPWGHQITAGMITSVPTLVVTGAWNAEYEAIAGSLGDHGATHVQLIGNEHRPQDHPGFDNLVCRHTDSLGLPAS